jgi:hypothetical protein
MLLAQNIVVGKSPDSSIDLRMRYNQIGGFE